MMYWLPKLHKKPYKAIFIANTNYELLASLLSNLVSLGTMRHCLKGQGNMFWSIKNVARYLRLETVRKLKSRGFRVTGLSTNDFSTLYTTLPHNLIEEKS